MTFQQWNGINAINYYAYVPVPVSPDSLSSQAVLTPTQALHF